MIKKLLFSLLMLLVAGTASAAYTLAPDIIVTPGEDEYTFDVVGEGEIHLTYKIEELVTGVVLEEGTDYPFTITRINKPLCVQIDAYAKANGKEKSFTTREYVNIPDRGIEILPAPEITVTQDGNTYIVQAVGEGMPSLYQRNSLGLWDEMTEGYCELYPSDKDQLLQFKASCAEFVEFYDVDNGAGCYDVRSPETRLDYVVPSLKILRGEIFYEEESDIGVIRIIYTGNEDVTIDVTLNGNPVELVDGKFHLVPGENHISVTVSAEGYLEPLYAEFDIYWLAQTPAPEIIVTPGAQAYTVEAVGEGDIHLYCEHYCEYHQFNGEMENPFTISRTQFDEIIYCYATASLGEGSESAYIGLDVFVPALGQTPAPTITFTEDETGCEVRAVGVGEVHLFLGDRDYGQEVQNPYRISRPYQEDHYSFEAYAQAEGQWESESVWKVIDVTPMPWICSNETSPSIYYDEVYIPDYEVMADGVGDVRLFMNGVEVENPYTVQTMLIDETCKFTATAKQTGKLTGDSYEPIEIAPGPKREHLVTIASDDANYYVKAAGDGYITIDVMHSVDDDYIGYSADGECEATVTIPRSGLFEWKYIAKRYKDGNLLGFEVGSFLEVFKELSTTGPYIFAWPGPNQYKIVAMPRYQFWIDFGESIQLLQYGTQLMHDGQVVDEPFYVDRAERVESYDFSAVTTLRYERYEYLGIIDGEPTYSSEPLETIQIFSDQTQSTINVRQGGDNFYYEYQDYEFNETTGEEKYLLNYEVNIKKNSNPDVGLYPDHAVAQANRDYSGIAVIRDAIKTEWYDISDGEPIYEYYFSGIGGVGELLTVSWPGISGWGFYDRSCVGSCPVTAIADNAFYGNLLLTGVEIGKNVREIGTDAFKGCTNLTSVTCWATTPPTMANMAAFNSECYSNATLKVPASSVEAYRNVDWWRLFQHIEGVDVPNRPGDVNGDGEVNIADVNALIDGVLEGTAGMGGDINGDGEVNIADINALIDMILSRP